MAPRQPLMPSPPPQQIRPAQTFGMARDMFEQNTSQQLNEGMRHIRDERQVGGRFDSRRAALNKTKWAKQTLSKKGGNGMVSAVKEVMIVKGPLSALARQMAAGQGRNSSFNSTINSSFDSARNSGSNLPINLTSNSAVNSAINSTINSARNSACNLTNNPARNSAINLNVKPNRVIQRQLAPNPSLEAEVGIDEDYKKRMEQQRRLREQIIRQKELRRLEKASKLQAATSSPAVNTRAVPTSQQAT